MPKSPRTSSVSHGTTGAALRAVSKALPAETDVHTRDMLQAAIEDTTLMAHLLDPHAVIEGPEREALARFLAEKMDLLKVLLKNLGLLVVLHAILVW